MGSSPSDIPQLTVVLQDQAQHLSTRDSAANSLLAIAQQTPDYRAQCVAILTSTLERYQRNPIELNTSLIGHLITLKAIESAALVQQVVKAGEYDRSLGDWTRVSRQLGVAENRAAAVSTPAKTASPNASTAPVSSDKPVEFFSPNPAAAAATIAAGPRLTSKDREKLRARKKQERKNRKQNRRR